MNKKLILLKIEELKQMTRGSCLCGHSEWCEYCSPSSSINRMRKEIIEL